MVVRAWDGHFGMWKVVSEIWCRRKSFYACLTLKGCIDRVAEFVSVLLPGSLNFPGMRRCEPCVVLFLAASKVPAIAGPVPGITGTFAG